jgi:hypothetical protein
VDVEADEADVEYWPDVGVVNGDAAAVAVDGNPAVVDVMHLGENVHLHVGSLSPLAAGLTNQGPLL